MLYVSVLTYSKDEFYLITVTIDYQKYSSWKIILKSLVITIGFGVIQ